MYTYRVSDIDSQKVKDIQQSQDLDNLKARIDNLNKSFDAVSPTIDKGAEFERLEMPTATDAELTKRAEQSLYDYKTSSVDKINNDALSRQAELNNNITSVRDRAAEQKASVDAAYAQAAENISNDALKRGLQRSSIVINNIAALNQAQVDAYNAIDKEVTAKIDNINFQIASLNQQKESALNDFNIAYAVKLDEKLATLKDNLAKQQLEVTKYNNEIAKLENDYAIKYANLQNTLDKESWDKEADLIKYAGEYGVNMLGKYKASRIYSMVSDYLHSFSHDEAKRILENSEYLQRVLGDKYSAMMAEI